MQGKQASASKKAKQRMCQKEMVGTGGTFRKQNFFLRKLIKKNYKTYIINFCASHTEKKKSATYVLASV